MISNKLLKQLALIVLIIGIGLTLFYYLREFTSSLLGAFAIYIITKPLMLFGMKKKLSKNTASVLVLIVSFVVLVLPFILLYSMLDDKVMSLYEHSDKYVESIKMIGMQMNAITGFNVFSGETLDFIKKEIGSKLPNVLNTTFNIFTVLFMMFFILYYMLVNDNKIEKLVDEYLPVRQSNKAKIHKEIHGMILSNAFMVPLIALIQGILCFIGYLIFGVDSPFFWFVITAFMALVPIVGSAAIWLPLALVSIIKGNNFNGIGLLIWGVFIVGLSDNFLRIFVQKYFDETHPLITIFGVIVGLKLFGFIGLLFGPILISLFLLLLRIYTEEYKTERTQ